MEVYYYVKEAADGRKQIVSRREYTTMRKAHGGALLHVLCTWRCTRTLARPYEVAAEDVAVGCGRVP
jgi:hypothetical protein